jgi:hypothetical protein
MECGGGYFALARMPNHVNPNAPDEDAHHHAFMVEPEEFDRVLAIMNRGIVMAGRESHGMVLLYLTRHIICLLLPALAVPLL